jgi:GT2 family glycosyltransferase
LAVTAESVGASTPRRKASFLSAARHTCQRAWQFFRPPRHCVFALRPGEGVVERDGAYLAQTNHPELQLAPIAGSYPSGWTVFSYSFGEASGSLLSRMYVDFGNGYAERLSWAFPATKNCRFKRAVRLPEAPVGLSFRPANRPTKFQVTTFTASSGGTLWLTWLVLLRAFKARPRTPSLIYSSRLLLYYIWPSRWDELKAKLMRRSGLFGDDPTNYDDWVQLYDCLEEGSRNALRALAQRSAAGPTFSVIMPAYKTPAALLTKAIESVRAQIYPRWELCVCDDGSNSTQMRGLLEGYARQDARIKIAFRGANEGIAVASNAALAMASGAYLAFLDHDDELSEHALLAMAAEIERHPEADVLYSDEDKIDLDGRRYDAYFKPDWNLDLFYAQNYLNHLTVYRRKLVQAVGGFRQGFDGSQDYDLALRVLEKTGPTRIRHIPRILYHWRASQGSAATGPAAKPEAPARAMRSLQEHHDRLGTGATAMFASVNHFRLRWPLPAERPLASLIVPTRNRVDLLRRCVEGIRSQTDYSPWELLLVDNGSDDRQTLDYLASLASDARIRVLQVDGPFNFSALNNRAAAVAQGPLLGFLNNDLAMIEPGWLGEMVSHALRPGVGAVGAKLFYANGTVQHAGVVLGIGGVAGHLHRFAEPEDQGYFSRAQLAQNFSAVTAACMVMPKAAFDRVGGFDEENLAVAFNDVDLCLRLGEAGYRIVWTPFARLLHLESATRGDNDTRQKRIVFERECAYMARRWKDVLLCDPAFNPNLHLLHEMPGLAFPPRLPPLDRDLLSPVG